MTRHRTAISLGPALLVSMALIRPASAAPSATAWTVVATPNPSSQANYLAGVAAVSTNDVWAVGAAYRPQSTPGTLTEHWNGSTWTLVKSPNATSGYNELHAASAVSSTDVWAVGYHNISAYGTEKTMALHWNGVAWTIVPTANIGHDANMLQGVAAVAANDVWAVGFGASTSNLTGRVLVEHWDGTRWSLVQTPDIGRGFGVLSAVAAVSANDVWAVGSHDGNTLIEHWDGTAWSVVPSQNGSRSDSSLNALSAAGPNDVWAAGASESNNGGESLIEHWDGTTWSIVASPEGNKPFTSLSGILALGTSDAWAVGTTYNQITVSYRTISEHWDGATWAVVETPNPSPEYDFLEGLAGFAGGDLWAVGAVDEDTLAVRTTDS